MGSLLKLSRHNTSTLALLDLHQVQIHARVEQGKERSSANDGEPITPDAPKTERNCAHQLVLLHHVRHAVSLSLLVLKTKDCQLCVPPNTSIAEGHQHNTKGK
jgi:hypothetical protein